MTCKTHTYDESEPNPQCWECGRPQNLVDALQRWINEYDGNYEGRSWMGTDALASDARDLLEWILMDMDPAEEK